MFEDSQADQEVRLQQPRESDDRSVIPNGRDVSPLALANLLLGHRRAFVVFPFLLALLVVTLTLLHSARYVSNASFTPQQGRSARISGFAGIASQLGLDVPTSQPAESPEFYAELLRSEPLLRATVETRYRVAGTDSEVSLIVWLHVRGESKAKRVAEAVERLRDGIKIETRPQTGTVEFSISTSSAQLSQQVAARLLELVNEFNLEKRQTRATAERRFIEGRLGSARAGLRAAEDSLEQFLETNRRYDNSPQLRFQYDRLQRRVGLRQQVVASLSESFERAKIEEVRNTPIITVLQPPGVPVEPEPRRLIVNLLLAIVAGAIIALVWSLGVEWTQASKRSDPASYEDFQGLMSESRQEVLGILTRLLPRRLITRFR